MTEARALSHTHDPDTSHAAVPKRVERERVKKAILDIFHVYGRERGGVTGLAAFEAQEIYLQFQPSHGWPEVQPHSIPRRMSELHNEHLIEDTGVRVPTPFGATAAVWRVAAE